MSSEYRVNKATGQVVKDDGTGWKPVASVRNKTTGEILIDEGNGWLPVPSAQRNLQSNPAMTMASERANQAMASGQKIAKDDLTQLGRPDFSGAAMARLPAPTMSTADLDAWEAKKKAADQALRVPDSNFKERSIIAMNVPTFGSGPRLAAGAQTLGALAATPFIEGDIIDQKGISGATSQFLDEARIHQRRGRTERPLESIATEVVPSLFQGKTIIDTLGKKLLPQANTAANVARVAGVGGGYGALYGASQNESGTVEGVAGDAAFGGALGVGGGVVLKGLEAPARVTYRGAKEAGASIYDALADMLGKAGGARDKVADEVAIAAVRRSMERSGMNINQIMDLVKRYEGKPAVLAEVLGQDAVNALTALTRRPGSTPQKAQDLIEERFYGRPDRMKADVEDATGIPIGQLDDTLQTQLTERQAAAKPLYDALYKRFNTPESFRQPGQTGQVQKRLNRLARTPLAQRHLQLAKDAVATTAARRGIAVSKMSKMEYWDMVKRSLDDAINSAKAKGEDRTRVGEGIEDLVGLKDELVTELDRLTGGAYAAAREAGGEAPRLKAAAAAGQKALQARNPREVAKTVAATLAQDLPALRAGMVEDLGTRIDKGMTPGRVRVPDVAGKLRAGLGDEAGNKLINRFDAEATLSETGARWAPRMNSVTGTVMESGATQMGDDLINAGMNLATGNKLGLVRQAINFMRTRGFSQRQIDAIGDLLLSSPEEGLKRLKLMKPDGAPPTAVGAASAAGIPEAPPTPAGMVPPTPPRGTPAGPIRAAGPGALRGDLGQQAMAIGLGSAGGSVNDLNDDGKKDWQDAGLGALGGLALLNGPRAVNALSGARRTVGSPRVASAGAGGGRKPPTGNPAAASRRAGRPAPDTLPRTDRTNWTLPSRSPGPPPRVNDVQPTVIPPGYGKPIKPPVTIKSPGQVIAKGLRGIDRGLRDPKSDRALGPVLAAGKMRKPKRGEAAIEAMRSPQEVAQAVSEAIRRGNTAAKTDLARPSLAKAGQKNAQIVQQFRNRLQSEADGRLSTEATRTQMARATKAAKAELMDMHGEVARAVSRNDEAGAVAAAKRIEQLRQDIADIKRATPAKERASIDATLALIDTAMLQAEQTMSAAGYMFRTALEPGRRKLARDGELLDLLTNPSRAKDAYRISQAKPLGDFEGTGQLLAMAGATGAGALAYKGVQDKKRRDEQDYYEKRDAWDYKSKHVAGYSGARLQGAQEFMNAVVLGEDEKGPTPDGKYGPKTADVIRRYQKMRGLTVNGRMTRETINDLESQMSGARP